jgi:hypothetical protein
MSLHLILQERCLSRVRSLIYVLVLLPFTPFLYLTIRPGNCIEGLRKKSYSGFYMPLYYK